MAILASSGALIRRDSGTSFLPAVDIPVEGDLQACDRFIKGRVEHLPPVTRAW